MTLSEFKNRLQSYMVNGEYDGAIDLLTDWDGCSDITTNMVDGYNCSLGDVINALDKMDIYSQLDFGSDYKSRMYVRIPICW